MHTVRKRCRQAVCRIAIDAEFLADNAQIETYPYDFRESRFYVKRRAEIAFQRIRSVNKFGNVYGLTVYRKRLHFIIVCRRQRDGYVAAAFGFAHRNRTVFFLSGTRDFNRLIGNSERFRKRFAVTEVGYVERDGRFAPTVSAVDAEFHDRAVLDTVVPHFLGKDHVVGVRCVVDGKIARRRIVIENIIQSVAPERFTVFVQRIGIVLVDRSQMAAATVSPSVIVFPPRSVGQAKVHIARLVGKVQADVFVSTVAEHYVHAERNLPAVHNFIEILFRQAHFSQNPSVALDRSVNRHIFPRVAVIGQFALSNVHVALCLIGIYEKAAEIEIHVSHDFQLRGNGSAEYLRANRPRALHNVLQEDLPVFNGARYVRKAFAR